MLEDDLERGKIADQPGQRAVAIANPTIEQLRGATNARQRVLDFVRQNFGCAQRRCIGIVAAYGQRLDPHRFLQDQNLPARKMLHRCGYHIDRSCRLI